MKREKLITCLWAAGLAFGLSFGAVACMATAFHMEISLAAAAGILLLSALLCAVCYALPLGAAPLGVGALALWQMWRSGMLEAAAEAILNRLSRQYHMAYDWEIIRWTTRTAPEMEPDLLPALCVLGVVVAMLIAWSVSRGKTSISGVLVSIFMLATCVVVTDTVPASGWLYLYLLSISVLLVTGAVRHSGSKDGNRLSLVATPAIALALLVLFLLNPAKNYKGAALADDLAEAMRQIPVFDAFFDAVGLEEPGTEAKVENGVDLRAVGRRNNYGAKVMEVTSSYTGTIYLRGTAMDMYDGLTWQSSGDAMSKLSWPNSTTRNETVTISTRYGHQNLYTPYYVQSVNLSGTVTGLENKNRLTDYTFSFTPIPSAKQFLAMYPDIHNGLDVKERSELAQQIRRDVEVRKWTDKILRNILADIESPYYMAQAIGDYVRSSATYSLNTDRMPKREKDFARWFLEDSDTGYCVHFATAATVLLQGAGLPARYVTGYMVQAQAGETVEVTADMAHAWAEYYLPGFGWTVLEATPAEGLVQPEETEQETELESSVADDPEQEETIPAATAPQTQQQTAEKKQLPWELLWILVLPVAIVGGAEGQYRLRRKLYEKRYAHASANEKALLCWQMLIKLANIMGSMPDKGLYPLAQKAAFSQHTITQQELQQLETAAENARRTLRQSPLPKRLLYRLVYAI